MKIYYARHQSLGVINQFPFLEPPSAEQLAAIREIADMSQGTHHPKERNKPPEQRVPYWIKVVEETAYGPTDIPMPPAPSGGGVSVSGSAAVGLGTVGVSGTGSVEVITAADVGTLVL